MDATGLLGLARGLLVFAALRAESPLREAVAVLAALAGEPPPPAAPGVASADATAAGDGPWRPLEAYGALFRALAESDGAARARPGVDPLTGALVDAVLLDENPLSRAAQAAGPGGAVPAPLLAAGAADLRALQALAAAAPGLPEAVAAASGRLDPPPWWPAAPDPDPDPAGPGAPAAADGAAAPADDAAATPAVEGLARRLAAAPDWGALTAALAAHYARYGSGRFARYRAFRWVDPQTGVVPVPVPDAVRPGDLIGYAAERALLRSNTVQFLAGYPANNVLLYGDRGTGKSSSVKALLNERRPAGGPGGPDGPEDGSAAGASGAAGGAVDWSRLRLIEVPKARLADFPAIVAGLRRRPQRFILFVDDLSFEEGETQYKDMKAMLEGGLEARPENVVVYATSNRRHLIREQFADRAALGSDEVHAMDTVQEKLSFADRFGLTITFPTPDQAGYLAIVAGLAGQRGLRVDPAALRARAIEWAAWHNGRSGRTARQFVDYLAGEVGLAAAGGAVAPVVPAAAPARP